MYNVHRFQEWRFSYIKYACSFNYFLVFLTDNINRTIGKLARYYYISVVCLESR